MITDNSLVEGTPTAEAAEAIETLKSYTERSQSGKGFHIVAKGTLPAGRRRNGDFEMYGHGSPRYFAMTGNLWGAYWDIEANQQAINAVHSKLIAETEKQPPQAKENQTLKAGGLSDNQVIDIAMKGSNGRQFAKLFAGDITGYESQSNADLSLANMLAWVSGDDYEQIDRLFKQSGLYREKWDTKHGVNTYGHMTITRAIDGCKGNFYSGSHQQSVNTIDTKDILFKPVIPLTKALDLPPFPKEVFPPQVEAYINSLSEDVQVSTDMIAASILAITALCVHRKFKIEAKEGWQEPLNLFSLIVAPPGERKSAIAYRIIKAVIDYEAQQNDLMQREIDYYQSEKKVLEGKLKKLEEMAVKGKATVEEVTEARNQLTNLKEIKPIRLWTDNATTEAINSLMAANDGCLGVVSAEGGIFNIMAGRYSNDIDIDVFLKGHTGDAIRIDRKGRPSEYIKNPALTMLLFIQPFVLEGLMSNSAFRGRGLLARYLFSIPASTVGSRAYKTKPIKKAVEDAFNNLLTELLHIPTLEHERIITLSSEADDLATAFFHEIEPRLRGDLEPLGDWAGKLHGATMRIAGILHTQEYKEHSEGYTVTGDTMEKAIRIGKYYLEHAKGAYLMMGADKVVTDAKYILRALEAEQCKEISSRDLQRLCRKFPTTEEMQPAIEKLIDNHYLIETVQEYRGIGRKPSALFKVNPEVYGQKGQM